MFWLINCSHQTFILSINYLNLFLPFNTLYYILIVTVNYPYMSSNIHFFLGPLLTGIPSHWLFVSCSRLSPSTGLCWTRHPPTVADYHDTPAVTGGLHPLLDIAPKNRRTVSWALPAIEIKLSDTVFCLDDIGEDILFVWSKSSLRGHQLKLQKIVFVVVFFFEYNKSWTTVNSILLRYNGVGIFNCRSFGITELW